MRRQHSHGGTTHSAALLVTPRLDSAAMVSPPTLWSVGAVTMMARAHTQPHSRTLRARARRRRHHRGSSSSSSRES